jgi:signal transduction histidine kinase
MSIDLVVLVASVAASMLLAIVVLSRNPQAKINRVFALFSFATIIWASFNYLADHGPVEGTLLFTRLTFIASLLIAYAAVVLGFNFPIANLSRGKIAQRLFNALLVITGLITFTPLLVTDAVQKPSGAMLETGVLYPIFFGIVIFAMSLFVRGLRLQYKNAVNAAQKSQIKLVLAGIVLYGVCASVANLILPVLLDDWTSSRYGPIFMLITVSLIGYAIVRHRLFDIRSYAVRSLAYLLSAFVAALLYVIPAALLTTYVLRTTVDTKALAVLVLITLVVAFFFQPVKTFFDNTTKRLFYRDAYDPQELFNKFNQSLVSTVDVEPLLEKTTGIIVEHLKAEFCIVGLERIGTSSIRALGTAGKTFPKEDLIHMRHLLRNIKMFPVVTDTLEQEQHELKTLLEKNNIAVLTPLFGHPGVELGHLMFGAKKSGSPYNNQDLRVISTLANELSIAMQNALRFEEIENFNATLQDKIEEATRKVRRTNDKLRKLDETKDDFISMASHQLRTPLTSVKGYVSMVLDGDAGKITPLQRKLLTQSFISSQRMVYLISDLLNVSRLKTGKFIIEPVKTNLADIIEEEVEQLLETAKGRNLELSFKKPEHFPTLMLDETKIRQVLMNFIDNAVYYTPSGGHIVINLLETPRTIEFTVVDDGIGVPRHEQHHLFSKFYRANNAKRARPDGTGLGLFMAKKVIIAQGGAVVFKSQEGRGSTFGFTFTKEKLLAEPPKQV